MLGILLVVVVATACRKAPQIEEAAGYCDAIVDDPSGNPIELFEPTLPEARLHSRS